MAPHKHVHPAGHSDDPAKVKAAIPGYEKILAEVNRLKAKYSYKEDDPTQLVADNASCQADEDWVPRNQWMNRLTGAAPWNSEAPPAKLKEHGFLTPNTVHYVRNHGIVPKLSFFDHSITVTGLVDKPIKISMQELVQMPTITLPVTLNCAGNRRKEQNLIMKGIGFDWGPSAASTAVWTGVPLHVFLEHVGIQDKAKWINFNGPVGEVPREDKTYGASHFRDICMNPQRNVMLAFLQNGEPLHPDHGYPVRLLIPGYIGGRMIKWLATISCTEEEGENWYHVYDNRVFPKHVVSRDVATEEKIWMDHAYRIDDRNLQSIMWSPAHCQKVPLTQEKFKLAGYAYNGSGKQPNRVEISLNGGDHWRVAKIQETEEDRPGSFGIKWCWVLWELEVPVSDLRQSGEICLRAWDQQNTQPDRPTWNLMGMMNNPWFRVKVHEVPGENALWFEHPTRVESSGPSWNDNKDPLLIAYGAKDLYVEKNGKLPSPGWMERKLDMVKTFYTPKEKEVLDKSYGWENMGHMKTEAPKEEVKAKPQLSVIGFLPAYFRSAPTTPLREPLLPTHEPVDRESQSLCSVLDSNPDTAWRKAWFLLFLAIGALVAYFGVIGTPQSVAH